MAEHNEWDLGSGLGLDGATVEVTDMEFGFNNNIGAGVVCANFTFTDDEGEEHEQSFSVGSGWEADRTGQELVSESGKARSINKNTNFGILIASAVEAVGDPSKLGGSPRHASTWLGHKFTMGTVKKERKNPSTGEITEKDVFVITEYHPEDGGGKSNGKAKGTKAAAKSDDTPEGWDALVELAKTFDDHDSFVEAALETAEVDGNRELQKAVLSTKAGSIWAEATS